MNVRRRDFVSALLLCFVMLPRWNGDGSESLRATVSLAFYTEYKSHVQAHPHSHFQSNTFGGDKHTHVHDYQVAKPEPFDMDGDGTSEAIVVPIQTNPSQQGWTLKVLDLAPIHSAATDVPLYPATIFTSSEKKEVPIKIKTGQLIIRSSQNYAEGNNESDSTIHHFCGNDWNDANKKCKVHCPNGLDSECPGAQLCFADTSCRIPEESTKNPELDGYTKTPNEGIPSIITLYSSGNIVMYSVISKKGGLKLSEMWSINPFTSPTSSKNPEMGWIDFVEVELLLETNAPIGKHGVVAGAFRYLHYGGDDDDSSIKPTLYFAIDALSGELLWRRDEILKEKIPHTSQKIGKPRSRDVLSSTSSDHRRRSKSGRSIVKEDSNVAQGHLSANGCLHHYGRWFMDDFSQILPHSFWEKPSGIKRGDIATDTKLVSRHLNQGHVNSFLFRGSRNDTKKRLNWISRKLKLEPLGQAYSLTGDNESATSSPSSRPNVMVFHNSHGVNIVSLRNGQQVCHQTFLDNILYGVDDRRINQVQLSTANHNKRSKNEELCEAYLQSGLDGKEDVAIFSLCEGMRNGHNSDRGSDYDLSMASPLLVEGIDGISDIVFAMNTGLIRRYDLNGNLQWTARPKEIPAWNNISEGKHQGFLGRIELSALVSSKTDTAAMRPIVLFGDDKLAIFSPGRGKLLATATFPQVSISRPILADLNGDGITDILVMTPDGIWGYSTYITLRRSIPMTVMNSLVILLIIFALVLKYKSDNERRRRRSTDL